MNTKILTRVTVVAFLGTALLMAVPRADDTKSARAAADSAESKPVESDMHEFMEYYFQPTYKRLRAAMADGGDDQRDWKAIKTDSLILAEGGNLLLLRKPENHADKWSEYSTQVRTLGAELYAAARKKSSTDASKSYTSMLHACNQCHQTFADGEHQLKP